MVGGGLALPQLFFAGSISQLGLGTALTATHCSLQTHTSIFFTLCLLTHQQGLWPKWGNSENTQTSVSGGKK